MESMVDFWKGKRVLITGHTGFKGAWLTQWLSMMGAEICGISDKAYPLYELLSPSVKRSYFIDIAGFCKDWENDVMLEYLEDFKPEIIFHLAAQSLVSRGYDDPDNTFNTNVMGTLAVYEFARTCKSVKVIVSVTSDKCYENDGNNIPFVETDKLGGKDPYSASKACVEILSTCYRESFFQDTIRLVTVRAGNVIGGGDWAENRLLPDYFRAKEAGRIFECRNPLATRPWQHVLDALHGYLMIAKKVWYDPEYVGAWNFGPDTSHTVKEVLDILGDKYTVIEGTFKEAKTLPLDSKKARILLGWKPILDFNTSVITTKIEYNGMSKELIKDDIGMFMGYCND